MIVTSSSKDTERIGLKLDKKIYIIYFCNSFFTIVIAVVETAVKIFRLENVLFFRKLLVNLVMTS